MSVTSVSAQVSERAFVGEAYQFKNDSSTIFLDKEIVHYTMGVFSFSNSWNALSI